MIIWGSKVKESVVSSGSFHCPECKTRNYDLVKTVKYFTLYFIPLFPMETLGQYVKCQSCKSYYKEAVLQYRPPTEAERLNHSIRQDLESGTPVQIVRQKLLNAGVGEDSTTQTLDQIIGSERKSCESCRLDFFASVKACSSCGKTL
jgi:zinc-ribbon family